MVHGLLRGCLELVTVASCGLCRRPLQNGDSGRRPCRHCRQRLELPPAGLQGWAPLPWWALGWYGGSLRALLLHQRRSPDPGRLQVLARALRDTLPVSLEGLPSSTLSVVAIPSWKRRGNPLPELIGAGLGLRRADPLRRSRPTLGQHHLNRRLRALNQLDAFTTGGGSRAPAAIRLSPPLLLVDDILTTGATAAAAAEALQRGGYRVAGLLCLARTPPSR